MALVLFSRTRRDPPGGRVLRLSSQPLTPQASVHVVRWDGEELLLGCTAQQVSLLARRTVTGSAEQQE